MTATIDLMYGSQSFRHSSSKVNVFALATTDFPANKSRCFPSDFLEPAPNAARNRRGRVAPNVTPARRDGSEINGKWYKIALTSKDGVLLLLQTNSTYHARPYMGAGMLVVLRRDADMIRVDAILTTDASAAFDKIPVFVGRGDIIGHREAIQMGADIKQQYINNYFQRSEQAAAFDITIMETGTLRPQLTTVTVNGGEQKQMRIPSQPQRRLRFRR